MNNIRRRFLLAASTVIGLSLAVLPDALAEDIDSLMLSPEQLFSATVISVSKAPERIMDSPAAVTVLTAEDIERSGATSIPEALRLVPGVQVARVNANGWAVSVRGFNSTLANKLLVLIDGREVYDALFSGVYWDVQDTVLEDIERIEVVRGPGGTLWGDNAVNGVINIITKKAEATQGNLSSALAGNEDKFIASERYGGRFGENGFYRVYGKYLNRDSFNALTGADNQDEWNALRSGFRADWKNPKDSRDDFTVQGDIYHSNAGQMRFFPSIATGTNPLIEENIKAHGGNILGRWTRSLSNDSRFTLQTYLDHAYRNQLLVKDERTSFDVDAQYEIPPSKRHQFIIGSRFRYSADQLTGNSNLTFLKSRDHDYIINGFIQDKITLEPDKWFLTLGSKLEYNSFSGIEIQPSARLQFHPDKSQMIWTSLSRAVRTPSRLEQDIQVVQTAGTGPLTLDTLPNPGFESEELVAYELGYRVQMTERTSLDVASFYNMYDKLSTITFQGLLFPPPRFILAYKPTNDTSGEAYGIESTIDWRATDALRFSASASLLDIKLHGPAAVTLGAEAAEDQSPGFQGNIRALWDITEDVSFDTTLYRVGALRDFSTPSYTRLDMRIGWQITDNVQFDLVGQNLFNSNHREFTSPSDIHTLATDVGTSIYGKITCRF